MAKASVYFTLSDTDNQHDTKAIKRELAALPGIFSVSVSDGGRVAVDFDTTGVQSRRIKAQLEKMGYQVLDSKTENHIMYEAKVCRRTVSRIRKASGRKKQRARPL